LIFPSSSFSTAPIVEKKMIAEERGLFRLVKTNQATMIEIN
jgi:hypothetical protein